MASRGYQVLQIDQEKFYGAGWGSLNLTSLEVWVNEGPNDVVTSLVDHLSTSAQEEKPSQKDVESGSGRESETHSSQQSSSLDTWTLEEFSDLIMMSCSQDDQHQEQHHSDTVSFDPLFVDRRIWYDPFGTEVNDEADSKNDDEVSSSQGQQGLTTAERLRQQPSSFNFDLSPKMLYANSPIVDVLTMSGVARYLDFRGTE